MQSCRRFRLLENVRKFFLVENVRKAMRIDEYMPDSLTTSLVDDVLYLLQRSYRRVISTSNINSVLAVRTVAINLVSNKYLEALQQKMRKPNLGANLFLGGTVVSKTGTEIATALNDMDVSGEYVLKLWHEVEEQCVETINYMAERVVGQGTFGVVFQICQMMCTSLKMNTMLGCKRPSEEMVEVPMPKKLEMDRSMTSRCTEVDEASSRLGFQLAS